MIETRILATADLNQEVRKTYLNTLFATNDDAAHQITVQLYRDKEAIALPSGATVNGYFIRYNDNATVPLTGTVSGNAVSVTLNKSCYSRNGQFALIIKVLADDAISTVFYGEGSIYASTTDTVVDPENIIPSLEDLLAQIDVMKTATAESKEATQAAKDETAAVASVRQDAEDALANAQEATNGAKGWANANATVTMLAPDAEAHVGVVTQPNGNKLIAFLLPKGETGVTPALTFQVATGLPGTDVRVEQSGTAEAPVIKLTIPQGATGSIEDMPYHNNAPAPLGDASAGTSETVARGDHVHELPTAKEVGAATAEKFTATLLADNWAGAGAPYTQTVAVPGMLATDNPVADLDMSGIIEATGMQTAALENVRLTQGGLSLLYRCKLTGSDGTAIFTNVAGIGEKPADVFEIIKQPEYTPAEVGGTVSFSVVANGVAKYQWQFFNPNVTDPKWASSSATGSTTATMSGYDVTEARLTYKFRCKLTGNDGTVMYTDEVMIGEKPANIVYINQHPQYVTAEAGDTISFSVNATDAVSYQWYSSNDGGTTWRTVSAAEDAVNMISAWPAVSKIETSENAITAVCYEEVPEVELPIILLAVR